MIDEIKLIIQDYNAYDIVTLERDVPPIDAWDIPPGVLNEAMQFNTRWIRTLIPENVWRNPLGLERYIATEGVLARAETHYQTLQYQLNFLRNLLYVEFVNEKLKYMATLESDRNFEKGEQEVPTVFEIDNVRIPIRKSMRYKDIVRKWLAAMGEDYEQQNLILNAARESWMIKRTQYMRRRADYLNNRRNFRERNR